MLINYLPFAQNEIVSTAETVEDFRGENQNEIGRKASSVVSIEIPINAHILFIKWSVFKFTSLLGTASSNSWSFSLGGFVIVFTSQ